MKRWFLILLVFLGVLTLAAWPSRIREPGNPLAREVQRDLRLLEAAIFDGNGDDVVVRSDGGFTFAKLTGSEGFLRIEIDGDELLNGFAELDADGGVNLTLNAADDYGGFSGQIAEIAGAKAMEVSTLRGAF